MQKRMCQDQIRLEDFRYKKVMTGNGLEAKHHVFWELAVFNTFEVTSCINMGKLNVYARYMASLCLDVTASILF